MGDGSTHRQALLYLWARLVVLVAVVLLLSETFLVLGVVTPVAIHGSSMAPALLGSHLDVTCPHCDWQFAVGADLLPRGGRFACPDCQREFGIDQPLPQIPGRRVWVNRLGKPDRWSVVVFRCPEQPTSYCIKRVLGLPGEQVDFTKGDLLIDGQVYRKSLAEQRLVRQLVHRERDQPSHCSALGRGWKRLGGQWQHHGTDPGELRYRPSQAAASDCLAYNQGATTVLHEVADLMLRCRLQLSPKAKFRCKAVFAGRTELVSPWMAQSGTVEWSLFDRQATLAINGTVVWTKRQDEPWSDPPWLSLVSEGEVVVNDLSIYRDAYYATRPIDRWPATGVQVAADALFVMGDNVAVSEDSRTWRPHGVPRHLVIGVPIGGE